MIRRITVHIVSVILTAAAFLSCEKDETWDRVSGTVTPEPYVMPDGSSYTPEISGKLCSFEGLVINPDPAEATVSGSEVTVTFPSSYSLNSEGKPGNDLPAIGYASKSVQVMSNLCGLLDIPVIGGAWLKGVQFTAQDAGKYASGAFIVDKSSNSPAAAATFVGNSASVSLVASKAVSVGFSDTLHVYVPLPPQTYSKYTLAFDLGDSDPVFLTVSKPLTIRRSVVSATDPVRLSSDIPLLGFSFLKKDNPNLKEDVICDIDHETGVISAEINYYADVRNLVPTFSVKEKSKVTVNGEAQKNGETAQNFNYPVTYSITDPSGVNAAFTVSIRQFTGLPVLVIDTPGGRSIDSKEEWVDSTRISFDGMGLFEDYDGSEEFGQIKGRGNATWRKFPKKPYNIRLGSRASLAGRPEHRRWSLIANYRDRTRLRNKVSFNIAQNMPGLKWTPHGEFVELFLNGEHKGMYLLTEQIRADENRVPVTEADAENPKSGYILQIDSYYNEEFHFKSDLKKLPIELKSPNEDVTDEMMEYVKGICNTLENYLVAGNYEEAWKRMDIDSFVDFWIVAELSGNRDAHRPGSDYMYIDEAGILHAGPIWDYDAFTYIDNSTFGMRNALWYPELFTSRKFATLAREHWLKYRDFLLTIPDYIDAQVCDIGPSEALDAAMWTPMQGLDIIQGDEFYTFEHAVSQMKYFYLLRLKSMDNLTQELVLNASKD